MRFVRYLLESWALNAAVLAIVAAILSDVTFHGVLSLLYAAAIFGALNTIAKPLLKLLTLPLAVVTLGLAWFGVAMLMLAVTDVLVPGFKIHGFLGLVWATLAVWAVNVVFELLLSPIRRKRSRRS